MAARVYRTFLTKAELHNRTKLFADRTGYDIRLVNTSGMSDIFDAFGSIHDAFSFPVISAINVNAMIDCLTDLSWLNGSKFALVIDDEASIASRNCGLDDVVAEIQTRWLEDKLNLAILGKKQSRFILWINVHRSW